MPFLNSFNHFFIAYFLYLHLEYTIKLIKEHFYSSTAFFNFVDSIDRDNLWVFDSRLSLIKIKNVQHVSIPELKNKGMSGEKNSADLPVLPF